MKESHYERLYYQMSRNPLMPVQMELVNEMQHLVQRSQFINPVHLPMLTESFLAKDFDYAEYMTIQLGKTLNEHFNIAPATLLTALPILGAGLLYVSAENTALYLSALEISIDASYISNTILFGAFILTICLYYSVRHDLSLVQRALFP